MPVHLNSTQSTSVLYACASANWDILFQCLPIKTQAHILVGRAQASPKPLIGAGLIQKLHRVVLETAQARQQLIMIQDLKDYSKDQFSFKDGT